MEHNNHSFDQSVPVNFVTASGRHIDVVNLSQDDVNLEDIVVSLFNMPRFIGHSAFPLSIGSHSVLVAAAVWKATGDDRAVKAALLHDASEAYLADIPSSLKKHPMFAEYRELERYVTSVIFEKFGVLEFLDSSVIKAADEAVCEFEIRLRDITIAGGNPYGLVTSYISADRTSDMMFFQLLFSAVAIGRREYLSGESDVDPISQAEKLDNAFTQVRDCVKGLLDKAERVALEFKITSMQRDRDSRIANNLVNLVEKDIF